MTEIPSKLYKVRYMSSGDVAQAVEIDREAFPTQWPPPSFSRELSNKLAHYLVVSLNKSTDQLLIHPANTPTTKNRGLLRRLFGGGNDPPESTEPDYVVGMVGLWLLFDESHIITIAVRQSYRGKGIGEKLLIAAIDLSMQLEAQVVTLEVRPSNTNARALYERYGFREEGLRVRYYSDNNEDALIMTTEKLSNQTFQERFQRLKKEHEKRWAEVDQKIS